MSLDIAIARVSPEDQETVRHFLQILAFLERNSSQSDPDFISLAKRFSGTQFGLCAVCSKEFLCGTGTSKTTKAVYCGNKCRVRHQRMKANCEEVYAPRGRGRRPKLVAVGN